MTWILEAISTIVAADEIVVHNFNNEILLKRKASFKLEHAVINNHNLSHN